MSWLFTEKLDRAIIEKSMINLLEKKSPNYKEKLHYKGLEPTTLENFTLQFNNETMNLLINGKDDWTKIIVTNNPNQHSDLLQITENDFYKEILNTLNTDRLNKIVETLKLNNTELSSLQSVFYTAFSTPESENKIQTAMTNAANNLTDYYSYLSQLKKDSQVRYAGIIKQKSDIVGSRPRTNNSPVAERKSPVYPFVDRAKIFEDLKPMCRIIADQATDSGNIEHSAITTYVYSNPRDNNGYLFAAEPLEGNHSTRMFFIPQKSFEEMPTKKNEDKLVELSRKFLEMSNEDFIDERFTKIFSHNDIASFEDRINYMISGIPSSTVHRYPYLYERYSNQLFNGERNISHSAIKEIVKDVPISEIFDLNVAINQEKYKGGENK